MERQRHRHRRERSSRDDDEQSDETTDDTAGVDDSSRKDDVRERIIFRGILRVGDFERRQCSWVSVATSVQRGRPTVRKTERLGLKYEVLASGSGNDCVEMHDVVDVDYVMRRANGYFIYSNADCGIGCGDGDLERWAIVDGFIETIPEMLVGAKKGEVRKFLVKPEFGYTTKNLKPQPPEFGQRRQIEAHCTEPLLFEVRVVKNPQATKG